MDHDHPRGADLDWYLEHLATVHLKAVDPTFSRATVMALHRGSHADEHEREMAHLVAPFNDRRPRQTEYVERRRPVRGIAPNGEIPLEVE